MRITDGFYDMYVRLPAMRALWQAMQSDAGLQAIDVEDCAAHTDMLAEVLARIGPRGDRRHQQIAAALITQLMAAAVRFAITLDPPAAKDALNLFKQTLPQLTRIPAMS